MFIKKGIENVKMKRAKQSGRVVGRLASVCWGKHISVRLKKKLWEAKAEPALSYG